MVNNNQDDSLKDKLHNIIQLYNQVERIAKIGNWLWDFRTGIVTCSKGLREIFEIPKDQVVDYDFNMSVIHSDDKERIAKELNDAIEGKSGYNTYFRIITKSGIKHIHSAAIIEKDKFNKNLKMIGAIQDVTQQKKEEDKRMELQKQVFQASKLTSLGELTAGIGHEINNPLAVIFSCLEELNEEFLDKIPEATTYIEMLITSSQRIKTIVDGLRSLSRSTDNNNDIVDVHNVIRSTIDFTKLLFKSENIVFESSLNAKEYFIYANVSKLQQALLNIISNAKDAITDKDGHIIIETMNVDETLCINITDNGCGILEKHINRIFDSFFTTKPINQGTGLGLSITYSLINSMNGCIKVDSEYGVSTTFKISFPIHDSINAHEHKTKTKTFKKLKGHALIVEDETDLQNILQNYLKKFGLTVDAVSDGESAIKMLQKNKYDYVLTDLKMPGLHGYKYLSKLKEIVDPKKIIVCTGGIDNVDYKEYAQNTLLKPFTKENIYDVISNLNTCD